MSSNRSRATVSSAYAIFEGGGAKGIAHVGAFKSMEAANMAIVGVAGTSAGAIIAALIAVGYRPSELFQSGTDNILTRLGYKNPIEVLGKGRWKAVRNLLRNAKIAAVFAGLGILGLIISIIASIVGLALPMDFNLAGVAAIAGAVLLLAAIMVCGIFVWRVLRRGGVFDPEVIERLVNEALRAKLEQHHIELGLRKDLPEIIRFRDIDPKEIWKCIPLKIVVTNVSSGELTLFDKRYRDLPVAQVVAASAALPGAFQPAMIPGFTAAPGSKFTDGGLVSNLPTWVFRDEKRERERLETTKGGSGSIPIYAFSLSAGARKEKTGQVQANAAAMKGTGVIDSLGFFKDVAMTGIFGSQAIVQNFVPDLRVVPITTELETLDFDCDETAAKAAIDSGERNADHFFNSEQARAFLTQSSLDYMLKEIADTIQQKRSGASTKLAPAPHLRLALIDPVSSDPDSDLAGFKVNFSANMANDADDKLDLDARNSIAAEAYNKNEVVFGKIAGKTPGALRMTKYERALLPPTLSSVIAVPVYAEIDVQQNPRRILALDSDDSLVDIFNDPKCIGILRELTVNVSPKLIDDLVAAELVGETEDA